MFTARALRGKLSIAGSSSGVEESVTPEQAPAESGNFALNRVSEQKAKIFVGRRVCGFFG
jgi:hypothetical protein